MSLLDTIKGAREEAEQAGSLASVRRKDADAASIEDGKAKSQGYARKSAANARPAREAASSVRVASSAPATKEEKKAAREARRSEEDLAYDTKKALLEQMPGYKRSQQIWWGLLIAGVLCTLIGWGVLRGIEPTESNADFIGKVTLAVMVLAYALVIGAFIFDMVKVRPMRNQVNEQVEGMTKKRMEKALADAQEQKAASKK